MKNDSNPLKRSARRPSPLPNDPLEQARRYASDARDIARDERRRMPGYDADTEEITKTGMHVTVNVQHPQPSQPDIETTTKTTVEVHGVKVTGLPKWVVAAVLGAVAGIVAAAARLWAR